MKIPGLPWSPGQQAVVDRFIALCQADERVLAGLLVGSYAIGKADAESDLDFCVITTDEAFGDFLATRADFIRRLGEPLFLDDFGSGIFMLSILSNGTEAELVVGHESQLKNFFSGPYRVLIDKQHLLDEAVPLHQEARNEPEQLIILRQQIAWFWHDMVHFITAMHRGQWWWAYGQLEALRAYCVNLTRLQHNFSDPMAGGETYFKIDDSVPTELLAPLQASYCPMEPQPMFQAAMVILQRYQELAPPLAQEHRIAYPVELERMISGWLEELGKAYQS